MTAAKTSNPNTDADINIVETFKTSMELATYLASEYGKRGMVYVIEGSREELNSQEKRRLAEEDFDQELKFTVPVNLADSKKAFRALVKGLEDRNAFTTVMTLREHDYRDYPHPLGEIEPSIMNIFQGKPAEK